MFHQVYKLIVLSVLITFLVLGCTTVKEVNAEVANAYSQPKGLGKFKFNDDWRFSLGTNDLAIQSSFDDSGWRSLTLPHDYAIEGALDKMNNGRTGGHPTYQEGWYRKSFDAPGEWAEKAVTIGFDGAMAHSTVWLNGKKLGYRPNGYVSFSYDISSHIIPGKTNVIAVRLKPKPMASRWYPGAGLYRDVWLSVDNTTHIVRNDSTITVASLSNEKASVAVDLALKVGSSTNKSYRFNIQIINSNGDVRTSIIAPAQKLSSGNARANTFVTINDPELWSPDNPYLYTLSAELLDEHGNVLDHEEFPLGIRTLEFSSTEGFLLNGQVTPIRGVCLHHDNGPIGAIANPRAIERKLQIMKKMGANAIRTAHNMPSPYLVEYADKLGLLVQIEAFDAWGKAKLGAENGYSESFHEWGKLDLAAMVRQYRNNPSVFMWSIGNEVREQSSSKGADIARDLVKIVKALDITRPTTAGFDKWKQAIKNGLADEVDVVGLNYKPMKYDEVKANRPDWIILGSETSSTVSSRGVYHFPIEKYEKHPTRRLSSYDIIAPPWAYPLDLDFYFLEKSNSSIGEFIWTGFDYIGEPTPYSGQDHTTGGLWNKDWPARTSYFGAVDLIGLPKDRYYLYQSQWLDSPMAHLLPHWNWPGHEGKEIPVYAYTNSESAELFLNGRSLGVKHKGKDKTDLPVDTLLMRNTTFSSPYRLSWDVPYERGELKLVARKNNKVIAEDVINTSGPAVGIKLTPDRSNIDADGVDLSYVRISIVDQQGRVVPHAENNVRIIVKGTGELIGVGNGDSATLEPFTVDYVRAFSGEAMAVVQSKKTPGKITVSAYSDGLKDYQATIISSAFK